MKGIDYPGVAVVYYCHDGQGNVVMQKRGKNCRDEIGKWCIGGGGLEFGDTIEVTLKKEIKEEYNTVPIEYEFLGCRDEVKKENERISHWIAIDFKVLVDRRSVSNGEPHKFDEIRWFNKDSLPEPLHSQLPFFFEKYKRKL